MDNEITSCDTTEEGFELSAFFPYQTRVFYKAVSQSVAQVYEGEYQMKPYEWRALAILGTSKVMTPAELVERSSMDKISVSRAIASLQKRGWLISRPNKKDGRSRLVRASAAGRRAYADLVPKMQAIEEQLLAPLSPAEVAELRRLMQRVEQAGSQLITK